MTDFAEPQPESDGWRLPEHWRPEPLFALGALSQYAGAAIAVVLFATIPAGTVALLRVIGAGAILVLIRRSWTRTWTRERLVRAGFFGSVLAAMNLSFYLAIDRLPLGNAVAIEFLGPVAVAALGAHSVRKRGALALAIGGVALLAGVTPQGTLAGVGFALLAATFWAGYIVLGARVAQSGSGVDGLGVGMLIGAIVISPVTAAGLAGLWAVPMLALLALATGLLSNAIPYAIDQVVLTRIDRSRFAFLQSLLPVTATVVGLVALAQRPSPAELAGILCVATAIVLAGE
ncbi:MAG TPA: EamA family transporter [Acidimicrobiia bacterium]|nr:EamA family transporter [Acidimicrobiia bacterium]